MEDLAHCENSQYEESIGGRHGTRVEALLRDRLPKACGTIPSPRIKGASFPQFAIKREDTVGQLKSMRLDRFVAVKRQPNRAVLARKFLLPVSDVYSVILASISGTPAQRDFGTGNYFSK